MLIFQKLCDFLVLKIGKQLKDWKVLCKINIRYNNIYDNNIDIIRYRISYYI